MATALRRTMEPGDSAVTVDTDAAPASSPPITMMRPPKSPPAVRWSATGRCAAGPRSAISLTFGLRVRTVARRAWPPARCELSAAPVPQPATRTSPSSEGTRRRGGMRVLWVGASRRGKAVRFCHRAGPVQVRTLLDENSLTLGLPFPNGCAQESSPWHRLSMCLPKVDSGHGPRKSVLTRSFGARVPRATPGCAGCRG